jgi:hypothetical protein
MMHHHCSNFQPEIEMQGIVAVLTTIKLNAMLHYAVLYYTIPYFTILHYTKLCHSILQYTAAGRAVK